MSKSKITCQNCKRDFEKSNSEINRTNRKGKRHFCSLSCSMTFTNELHPPKGNPHPLLDPANRRDEFSPFRYLFRTAKMHSNEKNKEFHLTLQDLKAQWKKQEGKCPYTGWSLILPETSHPSARGTKVPRKASLDRINSNDIYRPGNIQFVSMMANFAKNNWSENQLIDFCEAVAKNRSTDV